MVCQKINLIESFHGKKKVKFGHFATFWQFPQKTVRTFLDVLYTAS